MVSLVTSGIPNQWSNIPSGISYQDAVTLKDVLDKLDALDKKFGAKDCPQDAEKVEFLKQLDERIKKLEGIAKGKPTLRRIPPRRGRKG